MWDLLSWKPALSDYLVSHGCEYFVGLRQFESRRCLELEMAGPLLLRLIFFDPYHGLLSLGCAVTDPPFEKCRFCFCWFHLLHRLLYYGPIYEGSTRLALHRRFGLQHWRQLRDLTKTQQLVSMSMNFLVPSLETH